VETVALIDRIVLSAGLPKVVAVAGDGKPIDGFEEAVVSRPRLGTRHFP
jgi:hypothetical protein